MLVGCTSKEEMLQQRVQSMAASAELGTVEYTVKKIVKCDDKQTFAIGDSVGKAWNSGMKLK